jgi:hypothetical protein
MITGHFGLAAGVRSSAPVAPLWSLMLATMWLDVVFIPLYLVGVETLDTPAGAGYGTSVIHADYTHSLLGALILSAVFAGFGAWRWGRRVGVVLGGVAFSHWVLDLVMHRADLPLLPGNAGGWPLLGFGLWRVPAAAILRRCCWSVGCFCTGGPPATTARPGRATSPRRWSVRPCWCRGSSCWFSTPSASERTRGR